MDEEDLLEEALNVAGISNLKENFIAQKVTVDLIPLMKDNDLECIGVTLVGQRVLLRNVCKNRKSKLDVEVETKSIFKGETASSSGTGASSSNLVAKANRLINQLKSEPAILTERHTKKRKRPKHTSWLRDFQKNLVVIDFPGSAVSETRTLRESDKVYEGAITINSAMSEEDVRREVVSLVRCKKSMFHSFDSLDEDDIQFVKCANRRVRIPDGTFVCDGDGIKTMYRSGSVYVRFTRSFSSHIPEDDTGEISPTYVQHHTDSVTCTTIATTPISIFVNTATCYSNTLPTTVTSIVKNSPPLLEVTTSPAVKQEPTNAVNPKPVDPIVISDSPPFPHSLDPHLEYVDLLSDSDDLSLEDSAVQLAIENSITPMINEPSFQSVEQVLKYYATERCFVAILPEDRQKVIVRRKHILCDAKRSLKQCTFSDDVGLNITFIGEQALDAGGPAREFFRLVLNKINQDANLFTGPIQARLIVHNILALEKQEFHFVGHLIALSLMYGGGAPHFFSPSVVAYMLDEPIGVNIVGEILDESLRSTLNKLLNVTTTEEFQQLLDSDELSFRFDAGVSAPSTALSVESRDEIVIALAKNVVIYSCKAELDQLKEGLCHLGVLDIFHKHSDLVRPLLLSAGKHSLSSYQLLELFCIKWSPEGSNRRECEEAVVFGWTTYVHSCEGSGRQIQREDDSDEHMVIQVHNILRFATGADVVPPVGFDRAPEIEFTGDPFQNSMRLPSASTCGPILYLPLSLTDPDIFAKKMDTAIIGGQCFGAP